MLLTLTGIALYTAGLYIAHERIVNKHIQTYQEAFSKGYETKHGVTPYATTQAEYEPVSTYEPEPELEESITYKRERGDD